MKPSQMIVFNVAYGGGDPRSILYAKKELFKMRHGHISPFSAFLVFVFKVSGEVIITSVE